MKEQDGNSSALDSRGRLRNRVMLVGIMVLVMLPLLVAVFLYYGSPGFVTGARTNRGALLQPPAQLAELGLRDSAGMVTAEGPRFWRVLLFVSGPCDAVCLERVHMLRQVHRLLGRDERRVIRLAAFVAPLAPATRARLTRYFPNQELVESPAGVLAEVLASRALAGGDALEQGIGGGSRPRPDEGVLVVDPLGNVVLFHRLDQIGEALLFDLKRLLRLSNIG